MTTNLKICDNKPNVGESCLKNLLRHQKNISARKVNPASKFVTTCSGFPYM